MTRHESAVKIIAGKTITITRVTLHGLPRVNEQCQSIGVGPDEEQYLFEWQTDDDKRSRAFFESRFAGERYVANSVL